MTVDKQFYKKQDFWFGLGFSAVLFIFWTQISKIKAETARVMPTVLIIAAWVCCAVISVRAVLSEPAAQKKKTPLNQVICLLVVLFFSSIMLIFAKTIGMYTSIFLMICAISLSIEYMEGKLTAKKVLLAICYDLVIIAIIYVLFSVFLQVPAPKGILI